MRMLWIGDPSGIEEQEVLQSGLCREVPGNDNPSVGCADSSLYTREPLCGGRETQVLGVREADPAGEQEEKILLR